MTTWNPADKLGIVLSGGNLVAALDSPSFSQGVVRADTGITGKRGFYLRRTALGPLAAQSVSLSTLSTPLTNVLWDAGVYGWYANGGSTYADGVDGPMLSSWYDAVHWLGIFVDEPAGKIWFSLDGVMENGGDPATGVNPCLTFTPGTTLYPRWEGYNDEPPGTVDTSATAAFTAADMPYELPAGFLALDGTAVLNYAEAPTRATVAYPRGIAEAPTRALIQHSGVAEAPTRAVVLNTTATKQWTLAVLLDGVDISLKVVGDWSVTAEEGAARVARFSFKPAPGVIDPTAWTGTPVSIDMVRIFGPLRIATRIFTGVVDEANFDEIEQLVTFDCTDDLQNKVASLSKAEIDALVEGRYHVGVQGDIAEHWAYAKARMESVAGSLDAGPYGEPRVTLWDGLPVMFNFTGAAHVLGDTDPPAWRPQRRAGLVNEVLLTLKYRYYMCRERHAWLAWSKSAFGVDALASGYQYPTQQMVESALAGSGWKVISTSFGNAPAQVPWDEAFFYVETSGVANMTAHMAQRHAQTITEVRTIAVRAPASIAANGLLSRPMRAVVEGDWSPQEWEGDFSVSIPGAPEGIAYSGGDVAYAGTATRASYDEAYLTGVDVAKVTVLASHRKASQEFVVPAMPEVDLTWAAQITCGSVTTAGKVGRLVHRGNIEQGTADTFLTLALSGIGASGVVTPTEITTPEAPAVDEITGEDSWAELIPALGNHVGAVNNHAYNEDLMGFLCNAPPTITITDGDTTANPANAYFDAAWEWGTTGFRVRMPGVQPSHRNPVEIPLSETIDMVVPVDNLILTVT